MKSKNFSEITPDIIKLSEKCKDNGTINPDL